MNQNLKAKLREFVDLPAYKIVKGEILGALPKYSPFADKPSIEKAAMDGAWQAGVIFAFEQLERKSGQKATEEAKPHPTELNYE